MIRVGLVGFGMVGRVFHAPLISSVEGLELAAVMERTSDKAAERYPGIITYRSLDAMLADDSLSSWLPRPAKVTSRLPARFSAPAKTSSWTSLSALRPLKLPSSWSLPQLITPSSHRFITVAGTATSRRFRNYCMRVRWAV